MKDYSGPNKVELATQNLKKCFGELKALDGVSIEVKNGITLVIGPNGSGKTSLINMVTGFLSADEGKVFFWDREITNLPPHEIFKRGIVRTFQIPKPLLKLTVLENLLIAEANYGESIHSELWEKLACERRDSCKKSFFSSEFLGYRAYVERVGDEPERRTASAS